MYARDDARCDDGALEEFLARIPTRVDAGASDKEVTGREVCDALDDTRTDGTVPGVPQRMIYNNKEGMAPHIARVLNVGLNTGDARGAIHNTVTLPGKEAADPYQPPTWRPVELANRIARSWTTALSRRIKLLSGQYLDVSQCGMQSGCA